MHFARVAPAARPERWVGPHGALGQAFPQHVHEIDDRALPPSASSVSGGSHPGVTLPCPSRFPSLAATLLAGVAGQPTRSSAGSQMSRSKATFMNRNASHGPRLEHFRIPASRRVSPPLPGDSSRPSPPFVAGGRGSLLGCHRRLQRDACFTASVRGDMTISNHKSSSERPVRAHQKEIMRQRPRSRSTSFSIFLTRVWNRRVLSFHSAEASRRAIVRCTCQSTWRL
jgi:hypothetical protein